MPDRRNDLQARFQPEHRFNNFGDVLVGIQIRGFRGHVNSAIEFRSPISALCGINGCGKSTVAELVAAAYRNSAGQTYQISTFFAVGPLDPAPFSDEASVGLKYWQSDRNTRSITLSRDPTHKRWHGYRRRPQRPVDFISADIHVPRVERRDFVVRDSARLNVVGTELLDDVRQNAQTVLGQNYSRIQANQVSRGRTQVEVLSAQRGETAYSEIHMGCGEGRMQSLIRRLTLAPPKSLIVLEEPESALHQSAQYRLGEYLVDLSLSRGHQIIITTHSDHLLRALPQTSAIYLHQTSDGLKTICGLPPTQAVGLLSEGHVVAVTIVVEDSCAKAVLAEVVRRVDPAFLQTVKIVVAGVRDADGGQRGGGKEAILAAMTTIRGAGLRVAAVLDGDATAAPTNFVFKLPGTRAPEIEALAVETVKSLVGRTYGVNVDDVLVGLGDLDHHRVLPMLATRLRVDEALLTGEVARAYASSLADNEARALVELLKEAANR